MHSIPVSFINLFMAALMCILPVSCVEKDLSPAETLCRRIVGDKADKFEFHTIEDPLGGDRYVIESDGGKIRIGGNNYNSMAVGLNRYLNEYCHTYVSWYADDPVELPRELPAVEGRVEGNAVVGTRFFLNYCTFGYTMPYWKWRDWERLIDWMALNGINMPLAITGQEAVWMEVWRKFGLTDDEIRGYFTGPAHLPWHRMSNVDSWQGPLPQSYIDNQTELQKKILSRERELNMTPVLPAFAGHVPRRLAELYPGARIHPMSTWGAFDREKYGTYFIEPSDSLFDEIQREYMLAQTRMFGTDHVYGVDPFNEMDVPDWSEEFLATSARRIYDSMAKVDPEARWLQMTWMFYYTRDKWTAPRIKAFLSGVPEGKLLLLDYYCDKVPLWPRTENFHGQPYIWCYLGNFGGNSMLAGDMHKVSARIDSVYTHGGDNQAGLGATLEGFDVNPQMYEYVFDRAWEHKGSSSDPTGWIGSWSRMRGGEDSPEVTEAWRQLNDSIYTYYGYGGMAVLINSRPTFEGSSGWQAITTIRYNNDTLRRIWGKLVMSAAKGHAHGYDLVNIGRQVLGNDFVDKRDAFTAAYKARDLRTMESAAAAMDSLMLDYDRLLATIPSFGIGKWISDARDMGTTPQEKDYYEVNARTILTLWSEKGRGLNDYANRGWAGLTAGFYRQRWNMFTAAVIDSVKNGSVFSYDDFYKELLDCEERWTRSHDSYKIVSGESPAIVARELYEKYGGRR